MVTRPFSSVSGMSPIEGSKTVFYFLGQRWLKKFWSPLIDNPLNDGFWAKISIFFFQVNEMRDEAQTWWSYWARCCIIVFFKKKTRLALESRTLIWVPLLQAMTLKTFEKTSQ